MRTYLFASSDKKRTYRTTVNEEGGIACSCPAFRKCWHIKLVEERQPIGRTERTQIGMSERAAILALLEEGNDAGARERALELFPAMSEEETDELIRELQDQDYGESFRFSS